MKLTKDYIKQKISDNETIYKRGEGIYFLGAFRFKEFNDNKYKYGVDGSYGEYSVTVEIEGDSIKTSCGCPYPKKGCKHTIAACLDIAEKQRTENSKSKDIAENDYLNAEEIYIDALKSREKSAKTDELVLIEGDSIKGEHTVLNKQKKSYTVTIHEPENNTAHCTCPDFANNHLDTCKHIIFAINKIKSKEEYKEQIETEKFPFIHFTWNSRNQKPAIYYENINDEKLSAEIKELFDDKYLYKSDDITLLFNLKNNFADIPEIKFDPYLLRKINNIFIKNELENRAKSYKEDFSFLNTSLFPYQKDGVNFCLFKKSAVIADEMGLGKTIQAITIAVLKKKIFGFRKILVITPSSLKEQWKKEIEKFTDEKAVVVSGGPRKREEIYDDDSYFFKITNYEAVMRDVQTIRNFKPDFIILDEAQRIKNFDSKTHKAVLSIPHEHSLIITGTPLENKLEDLYAIFQFADNELLSPLWIFAANHFNMSRTKKNKVLGYKNLNELHDKIKTTIIRRKKEDVFESLPNVIVNTYMVPLEKEQSDIHSAYVTRLFFYFNKKFLTAIDMQRIQEILLCMRMVSDSTYLIDKRTNISPKLTELKSILNEIVIENNRKTIIFSEWTTMTFLIAKVLSEMGIKFVELSGKIPVNKRQLLIDEFNDNPDCKIFLSTDAGGVGLNLQTADCVINFDLPWNPAKLNQRIGRINRIGQKSKKLNVVNLVSRMSIEENVLAGIELKNDVFKSVLDGFGEDEIIFSSEKKNEFINKIRSMFGEEEKNTAKYETKEEIPEDTPGFLNPQVLPEEKIDISIEETIENIDEPEFTPEFKEEKPKIEKEKLEDALDHGMKFLSMLSQMTTGKPIIEDSKEKSIVIDEKTGEVTLKFKLPGF